jgi:uncharacterized protein (TIGR00255 family)
MIASMTGYGQSQLEREKVRLGVELRSVNNRFLDIQVRMPKFLQPLENRVKDLIQRAVSRGKINLSLTWESGEEEATRVTLNPEAAEAIHKLLTELKSSLGLDDDIRLEHLVAFSEIFRQERVEWDLERSWILVKEAVEVAMEDLQHMRLQEGEQLLKDIVQRIQRLEKVVSEIERLHPEHVKQVREDLTRKITALLDFPNVDEGRLAMEVALLAEKSDITEECVRFHSHNKLFLSMLKKPSPVGRKLTFLLQEMNREANTMASKANNLQVAHRAVELKEEIERIREQVQNVE